MTRFQKKNHAVHALHAHMVLTPRYRRPVFADQTVRTAVIDSITMICCNLDIVVEAIEADRDHLHLLIRYPPSLPLSAIAARIKGASSRAIRLQNIPNLRRLLWGKHFWSPSYCVVSCGGAPLSIIKRYVEEQGKEP